MTFRPMLAAKDAKLEDLRYPLLASVKLDGVRAVNIDSKLMSRTMKPIPNHAVRAFFGQFTDVLYRMDGELIVGAHDTEVYRRTVSQVMTHDGSHRGVKWCLFDQAVNGTFKERLATVIERCQELNNPQIVPLPHYHVKCPEDVLKGHEDAVAQGYEGLILRDPNGSYKQGRSTLNEQGMIKVKMFSDSEAVVTGVVELMHNLNEQKVSEIGTMKRSSHKENKVAGKVMGALQVRDIETGVDFEIGTGFTDLDRAMFWQMPPVGKIIKYKHFAHGVKDKPRFPVFLGLRPAGA